jgi:predicted component of type VI protein secretion system
MPKLTLSFKGRVIDVFHLKEGVSIIGRDDGCDISIDSLAVAPSHARVLLHDHKCLLEGLDDAFPILINHNKVASAELQHGDVIQIGKHTLSFAEDALELGGEAIQQTRTVEQQEADEKEASEQTLKGILQILNGENFGRIIPLNRNMTRIGRTGGNCAMIAKRDSGYYISYLEGAAPLVVNQTPIGEETQRLADGDIIEVGSTQMQFHL